MLLTGLMTRSFLKKKPNKKNKKPQKKKQSLPHETKLNRRRERNAASARKSRQNKKEIQAEKDSEMEKTIANLDLTNKKLAKRVEIIENIKDWYKQTYGSNEMGVEESELGHMQLIYDDPEDFIDNDSGYGLSPITSLIQLVDSEEEQNIGLAVSIEESLQDIGSYSTFNQRNS